MKNALLAALFITLTWFSSADACSIQIFETQTKNQMVLAAANEFNVALTKVSAISVTGFSHQLLGVVPGSSCEKFLEFRAKVRLNYRSNLTTACELNVDVVYRIDMHAEAYPFEFYEFNLPASSCARVPIVIDRPRDIQLPRPIPRP